jgi:hypothetical protein
MMRLRRRKVISAKSRFVSVYVGCGVWPIVGPQHCYSEYYDIDSKLLNKDGGNRLFYSLFDEL